MRVRRACTSAEAAESDLTGFADALAQPEIGLIFLFAGSTQLLGSAGAALARRFPAARILGCSSFGQIGPDGYRQDAIAGTSIHRDDIAFEIGLAESLSSFELLQGKAFAWGLREKLRHRIAGVSSEDCFAFMLIDGQSGKEELVARAFHDGLGGIRLVGGSAGGGRTRGAILCDRLIVENAALLLVGTSPFLFEVFKTQDFFSSETRMVVTEAFPARRIVTEINGLPAAQEYARLIGLPVSALTPEVFSDHPLIVRMGETDFIRSIESVAGDSQLHFYCAVEEGNVFRLSRPTDPVSTLRDALESVSRQTGSLSMVLGCDCCLRQIAIGLHDHRARIDELLMRHRVTGFASGGEQFCGMHVNQTFTGIAFGRRMQA